MKNTWRKSISLLWFIFSMLLLTAASPQQTILSDIPWWVWLVVIAVVLLVLFILVVAVDWRSAGPEETDKQD